MNGNLLKSAGFITAGAVAGGILGYFLGRLIVNQLQKRAEELEWQAEDEAARVPRPQVEDLNIEEVTVRRDYTQFSKDKGELSELVKPYTSLENASSTIGNNGKPLPNKEDTSEKIMIISYEDYEASRVHNKEPVAYYEDDLTFANAQEEVIDNPNEIFGPNIHLHFGEESDDPDIVYVRNENNGVDYEITRVHNSYSVLIMGMPKEEQKENKKRTRRRTRKVNANDDENDEDDGED